MTCCRAPLRGQADRAYAALSQNGDGDLAADPFGGQMPDQIVDTLHGCAVERDYNIAKLEPSARGRAPRLQSDYRRSGRLLIPAANAKRRGTGVVWADTPM